MQSQKYFSTTIQNQKKLTADRLSNFLNDPKKKVFFMNEPVGYGKTTTLMDLCLKPKSDGSFNRSIFLTYSNRKASELEGEFLERLSSLEAKPRILRVFGETQIKDEIRYREENDISFCENSAERKWEIERGSGAPYRVCEHKCKVSERCPYYRTVNKARSNVFDVLIGNLNEMQTAFFYTDTKFKLGNSNFLILDEDAVRKSHFEYSLPAEQMVKFVQFLPEVSGFLKEDESLKDLSLVNFEVLDQRLQGMIRYFQEESGFYPVNGQLDFKKLESRGFDKKKISIERSETWYRNIEDEAKTHRKESWYKGVKNAILTDARIEIQKDSASGDAALFFFPNLKDYRYILSQIGFTNPAETKVIITDATSTPQEIAARFQLDENEFSVSYNPIVDGFIEPKGKLYQVVESVSKSKYFDSQERKIKTKEVTNILEATRTLCEGLDFSKTDSWLIPFKEFAKDPEFISLAKQFGFHVSEKIYHGSVRGLNELKEKDIVILGSNFPRDKDLQIQLRTQLSSEVQYQYIDQFLQWNPSNQKDQAFLVKSPMELGIRDWMSFVDKDFGKFGRKVYLENVIQSMRSRFFWKETKTLIFSAYPLTDFGIAVHGLMSRNDFRGEFLKKVI